MFVMYGKWKVWQSVVSLCHVMSIECHLMDDGDIDHDILDRAVSIIMTPGIKPSHDIYTMYHTKVISELDFLYWLFVDTEWFQKATFVGITGTNGKSTTTRLTYNTLLSLYKNDSSTHVWLTWNFDIPLSTICKNIIEKNLSSAHHVFVCEVSSFMLYNTQKFQFDYGIWLNIQRDHLDWHGTMDDYVRAKKRLIDLSHLSFVWYTLKDDYKNLLDADTIHTIDWYFPLEKSKFLWQHNSNNLSAVYTFVSVYIQDMQLPYTTDDVMTILCTIDPLPHRLQIIKKIGDVCIVDDGICTSVAALEAALSSFNQKVVLIAWWYNKGDNYDDLLSYFTKYLAAWFFIGNIWQNLVTLAQSLSIDAYYHTSLQDAVQAALLYAQNNHIPYVLFSPWAASFDMFTNVYDRIEKFERIVASL